MIWRWLYSAALWLALPGVLLRLWLRGRREPVYRQNVSERFGWYGESAKRHGDSDDSRRKYLWIHAVSLGEFHAARPLIERLLAEYPDLHLLLTQMTATGREAALQAYGEHSRVRNGWLPYDYPFAVRRFFEHFRPCAGVIMETEVWFNLLRESRAQGVPMMLANARLSEKSCRGYLRLGTLAREAFASFCMTAAQGAEDASRLARLGARPVEVTGNLKFDTRLPQDADERVREFRGLWGSRPVLLAASTRDGEEALLLDAFSDQATGNELRVIVPRHPQRFDEVARLLERRGIAYVRRSAATAVPPECGYVLGDSVGEMAAYYGVATVAFVGGSLRDLGGQNFIEACAQGVPVLLGPHTRNFEEAARGAIESGAALRVQNANELVQVAHRLLADEASREAMSRAGLAFCSSHRGATDRIMNLLRELLATSSSVNCRPATGSPLPHPRR